MAYTILLAPPAERQLKSFAPPIQKRLVKRLKTLRDNPRPQGVKTLAGEDN
jgi:mRNA-degrading endonuclease RelE of RelBE toxin-antitoxin system